MKPINHKGQMEMIGLVIIVILITLGMLFMAQFALKPKEKQVFTKNEFLVYSTMGALMKTHAKCINDDGISYLQIEGDLIEDCAESTLGFNPLYSCKLDGELKDSCDFLEELIKDLLDQTLGTWGKHYELKSTLLTDPPEELFETIKDEPGCPGEREASDWWISTNAGQVNTVLYLCD